MNERGVSGLVVTVLIVLISIVAVGILWVAVVPQLDSVGESFNVKDCLNNDLTIKSCEYDNTTVSIVVQRGAPSGKISGLEFIFDQAGKRTVIQPNVSALEPLESKRFAFSRSAVPIPSKVQVAGVIGDNICNPSGVTISCGASQGTLLLPQCFDSIDNDGDGLVDLNDPGCVDSNDNDESNSANSTWFKLNNGNPIDGGEAFTSFNWMANTQQVVTVKDSAGNLLYTLAGENPTYMYIGRLTTAKSWEILTFNGWSALDSSIAKPLLENRFLASRIKLFTSPTDSNQIMGTFAAVHSVSNERIDIHDREYSFILDGVTSRYWSANQGYTNNTVTPISSSIFGTPGYQHDTDKNDQIVLSVSNLLHTYQWLTAARYKNGNWQNWQNNGWAQPNNFVYSEFSLHIPALPFSNKSRIDKSPLVTSIPGTQQFIVMYYSRDTQTGLISLKAAKYDDTTASWSWWNNGWQTDNAVVPQSLANGFTDSDSDNQKLAIVQNDMIYILYLKYGSSSNPTLYKVTYNTTSQVWGDEVAIVQANKFALSNDPSGQTWMAYSNPTTINLAKFSNGVLSSLETIYPLQGNMKLMGLDFLNADPIVFVGQGSSDAARVYALGKSGAWGTEQTRLPRTVGQPVILDTHGMEKGQFGTKVQENISYGGVNYLIQSAYGSQFCGHMAQDSENNIYCPKVLVNGLGIFPQNYTGGNTLQNETAHHWGGVWDYFYFPSSVAVDNIRGKVYVTDNIVEGNEIDGVSTGNIQVWQKSWNNQNVIRDIPNGSNTVVVNPLIWTPQVYNQAENGHSLNWPSDMAINEQRALLYVTETNFNRVVVYNISTGAPLFLNSFGSEGNGLGQFDSPVGIDLDSTGNIYVVDSQNHRIEKFDSAGNFMLQWGGLGSGVGQFIYPYSIAIDKVKGYVYVGDTGNKRLQIFQQDGSFVYAFGQWAPQVSSDIYAAYRFDKMGGIVANNNTVFVGTERNYTQDKGVIVKFQMNLP